jgi:hypothetical protein
MFRRKVAIFVVAVVILAGVTAWILWRGRVFNSSDVRTNHDVSGSTTRANHNVGEMTITEIPRPNSGTYTTEEATALLPKTIVFLLLLK